MISVPLPSSVRFLPKKLQDIAAVLIERILLVLKGEGDRARQQRSAFLAFGIRVASAAIAFLSQIFLARWLGQYNYGVFVWVWIGTVILGGISGLGFSIAVIRFVPEFLGAKQFDRLRGVLLGSRLVGVCAATVMAGLAFLLIKTVGAGMESPYIAPLVIILACLPLYTLTDIQDGICRGFGWVEMALTPPFLIRPLLIPIFMVAGVMIDVAPTAENAAVAAVLATWVTALIQTVWLNRRLKKVVPAGSRMMDIPGWLKISLPIFALEGFIQLLTSTDILVISRYVEPDQIAIYYAAVKTLVLVSFVHFAITSVMASRFSHYYSTGDMQGLAEHVGDAVRWTFWPSLLVTAMMLLVGKFILSLFGAGYEAGYVLLFVMALGLLAKASVGPAESLLTMSGRQNWAAAIYGLTFFINLALNFSLVPIYGLIGAAAATAFSVTFESAALYACVRRTMGLSIFVFHLGKVPTLAQVPPVEQGHD